ncbi:hypothetical protein GOV12_06970 [Candidatus Pacearchaeota archaeon]|nr:hypothetical protein [Candidatus Pacearchaeota archaeon]
MTRTLKDDKTFISYHGLYWSTSREDILKFEEKIKGFELNDFQKDQIRTIKAYSKTYEGVTFKCRARKFKHLITGEVTESVPIFEMSDYVEVDDEGTPINEEEEKQQEKKTKENIKLAVGYHYHKQDF